ALLVKRQIPVLLLPDLAMLKNQTGSRANLLGPGVNRERCGNRAENQILCEGGLVHFQRRINRSQRTDTRREGQLAILKAPVDVLDAEPVDRQHQALLITVPQSK